MGMQDVRGTSLFRQHKQSRPPYLDSSRVVLMGGVLAISRKPSEAYIQISKDSRVTLMGGVLAILESLARRLLQHSEDPLSRCHADGGGPRYLAKASLSRVSEEADSQAFAR